MSFHLPSFGRIRMVALVIGFFMLFWLIGFVKWCFASPATAQCWAYIDPPIYSGTGSVTGLFNFSAGPDIDLYGQPLFSRINTTENTWVCPSSGVTEIWFYDETGWVLYSNAGASYGACYASYGWGAWTAFGTHYSSLPSGCPAPPTECTDQDKADAYIACGGIDNFVSLGLECEPICKPCDQIAQQCQDSCGGKVSNMSTCTDDGTPTPHSLSFGPAGYNCVCMPPVNDGCDTATSDCIAQCVSSSNVAGFACSDVNGVATVTTPCTCTTPPDPNNPDEGLLKQIRDNTGKTADNTNGVKSSVDGLGPKIDGTTSAVNGLGPKIDGTTNAVNGLGTKLDGVKSSIDTGNSILGDIKSNSDAIKDDVHSMTGGTYTKENIENDYTITPTDEQKSQYTNRFNSFLSDMRSTPLFSLPDQVLGNIPSGGNPVYTVNMGQYGSSDIDLSQYSPMLAIVRAVFMTCFSFAALRIVLSHR